MSSWGSVSDGSKIVVVGSGTEMNVSWKVSTTGNMKDVIVESSWMDYISKKNMKHNICLATRLTK